MTDLASTDFQACWDETDDRMEFGVPTYGIAARELWMDRTGVDTETWGWVFSGAGSALFRDQLRTVAEGANVDRITVEQGTRSIGINEQAPQGYEHVTKKSTDPASGTPIAIWERCGADNPQVEIWDSSNNTPPTCGTPEQKWGVAGINSNEQLTIGIDVTDASNVCMICDDGTQLPSFPQLTTTGCAQIGAGGALSSTGVACITTDDDVPEAGDFGALALTGPVTSVGLATTIAPNVVNGTHIAFGSDAQGDLAYYDGTNWVRLAAGTSGHFLKTNGAAANPAWAAAGGSCSSTDGQVHYDNGGTCTGVPILVYDDGITPSLDIFEATNDDPVVNIGLSPPTLPRSLRGTARVETTSATSTARRAACVARRSSVTAPHGTRRSRF